MFAFVFIPLNNLEYEDKIDFGLINYYNFQPITCVSIKFKFKLNPEIFI